jgi:hypothetical protein
MYDISGILHILDEVFSLFCCSAAYVGSCSLAFWDSLSLLVFPMLEHYCVVY